jgi:hypothetical protein
MIRLTRHVAYMGEKVNAFWVLVEISEGNRQIGRPTYIFEYIKSIKINLKGKYVRS